MLNLNMFLLTDMVLSKDNLKLHRDYFKIFSFYTFDTPFFPKYRPKKSREKSYNWISKFWNRFFDMKNPTLWKSLVKSSLHDHNTAVSIVEIIFTGSYFQVTASTK